MNKDLHIERLLDAAEHQGMCATSADNNQRRKFVRRVMRGELISPHPRLYIRAEVWGSLNPIKRKRAIVRTLARLYPDRVFAAESALCMYDLEQPYDIHPENELTIASSSRGGTRVFVKSGFVQHTLYMSDMPMTTVNGVRVTSLARTLFDCVRLLPFEFTLPVADAAAKSDFNVSSIARFPIASLDEANTITRILANVDARSDNGGESRARAVMEEGGYMRPQLQYPFVNPNNPEFPLRADFIWFLPDGSIIVGEYDGMAKYGATWTEVNTHVSRQCERDDYLRQCGVTKIVHFDFSDVTHRERLYGKLDDAGVPRMR